MELDVTKIKIEMARRKISIAKLAELYGVSRNRIYVLLNQREVSTVTAGKLADALGVDVTAILED